jgi:hypothetical protein
VANFPNSEFDERGLFEICTCSFRLKHIFPFPVCVKHIFPFPVCVGQKLGDFLTHREDAPNVGQYLLITHSCFGGFFYSHKEHPRVNSDGTITPCVIRRYRPKFSASIIQYSYSADFFFFSVRLALSARVSVP